ncbi:Urea carboxylase-associated protein 2 [Gloeomargarita lithophora Alchichica-D10]|uniref:Urea carboxylase-associated protein 2 n=1 Tax=Gloeomargarita lithophora Alchichica-D10 TaxID=1188229 RepID=A0A1J0AEE7_9CYAN|nr:urea amidolyase associated protein UAAP1 [Gloeomargarita lithophora]APB34305.1 Urea carboxylase-associated protein 2 [Gloeomargarita lithophora Alchichica-D10]
MVAIMNATETNATEINPEWVVWSEKLPGGAYWHGVIPRWQTLRITDLAGSQGVAMICYNAERPMERLNVADTAKIQFNAFLHQGQVLYSDMGRVLFSITADTANGHDLICGCSTTESNRAKYGVGEYNKFGQNDFNNSRDQFLKALGKWGMCRRDLMPNVNFFSRVTVTPTGGLQYMSESANPGAYVDLRAEMNVLVVISNCPHVLHPAPHYRPQPVQLTGWRSPAPTADDPCRTANEEAIRGFVNTDSWWAQRPLAPGYIL